MSLGYSLVNKGEGIEANIKVVVSTSQRTKEHHRQRLR